MFRATLCSVRGAGACVATLFACTVLLACTEVVEDDPSTLSDPDDEPADDPEDEPAVVHPCGDGDCDRSERGTPVPEADGRRIEVKPEHAPRVLSPMVAVPFDPEAAADEDPIPEGVALAAPRVSELEAEVTVVAELAEDAPVLERPFDAPSPDDAFVTWFTVTEVIAGDVTLGDTVVVTQPLTAGFPKSDGFLRPLPGKKYVLLLDRSTEDPDDFVLAGGRTHGHHAFLAEHDDGGFAFERGVPMPLDEIRTARSAR